MRRNCTYLLVLGLLFRASAEAVIVAGGDGTQNTTSPVGGQGWDYVGRIIAANGAPSSVTYISNNWFITANHIKQLDNPTGVILGGLTHDIDPNSWTGLTNSEGGSADLVMFRVVGGTVNLAGVMVRSLSTSNGSALTLVGNGRNREISETAWNPSWVEGGKPTAYTGYKWASGSTKRWGMNVKDADAGELINIGYGSTDTFYSDFDNNQGDDEAQGATYDSGGGVFYDNGGDWELAGIMVAVSGFSGQPGSTSVYGNRTYIADMQYYASQISSTAQIDDIDEDGIPDEWEYEKSGSTTGVVASADQDGDGFSGEEEWLADTLPNDSNSFLRVTEYTNATHLVFTSSTNRKYQIQYRLDLSDTNETWGVEADWFDGSQPLQAVSTPSSNRFYRVRAKLR